jgi:hypothetical protein
MQHIRIVHENIRADIRAEMDKLIKIKGLARNFQTGYIQKSGSAPT